MKPIKRVFISNVEVSLVDANLVLESNSVGRGFITVLSDADLTNKVVNIDVGYTDSLMRYFTGYIERSQKSENGAQRLFVRELVGVFDKPWPCSFQHPTLKDITIWLTEKSGLKFVIGDGDYSNKKIPHFTHSGTGLQLLTNLGRSFNIPDYYWQQMPDGTVFVGSYQQSAFANKPITIPQQFIKSAAGGNAITLPTIQTVRPGVIVNDRRIKQVQFTDDEITLTYDTPTTKSPSQRQIEKAFPELAAGLHLPKMGKVVAHSDTSTQGQIADRFRPRYAVDIQLLDENGKPAANTPVYPAVPLPVPMAGIESGCFQYPALGTTVEIGFTEGRPDQPFVRQIMSLDQPLPAIKPGEQLQQQRAGVYQRFNVNGDIERETDQAIIEKSVSRNINTDNEVATIITRNTTIKASDTLQVTGTLKTMAGNIQQLATGDHTTIALADIKDKAGAIRESVAATMQRIIAPQVHIGTESLNVLQLMLATLDVVAELASVTSNHTHPTTAPPTQAAAIAAQGMVANTLKGLYSPIIK